MADKKPEEEAKVEDGADEEGAPKKSKKKMLLFIALPAVIVLLLAVAGGLMFMGGDKESEIALDEHGNPIISEDAAKDAKLAEAEIPLFYQMPDILVNISGETDGEQLVLIIKMQLEVPDEKTIETLDALLPRVIDHYQSFLRELRVEDIKGSAGNYRLRLELLRRVNLAVQPAHVNDVLIEKLLVN
ncbi:MAG: flagellar basal body-associated FliL family protein [Robiginitomaculum sp.]|nr:flagellar basal body-associated FliL family protein [Robiginitomaculum sp.]